MNIYVKSLTKVQKYNQRHLMSTFTKTTQFVDLISMMCNICAYSSWGWWHATYIIPVFSTGEHLINNTLKKESPLLSKAYGKLTQFPICRSRFQNSQSPMPKGATFWTALIQQYVYSFFTEIGDYTALSSLYGNKGIILMSNTIWEAERIIKTKFKKKKKKENQQDHRITFSII